MVEDFATDFNLEEARDTNHRVELCLSQKGGLFPRLSDEMMGNKLIGGTLLCIL